jgi:hypothetical protein
MNVTALRPTDTSIATLDNPAGHSFRYEAAIEPEVVRSGTDRRRRQDRRTEDQVRRRMVYGLEALVWDGTPVPQPARTVAAARLFSEGNHFLTGTIIDRSA